MDKMNLVKILEGNISLIDQVNVKDVALPEDHVTAEPRHVRKMLKDYLAGKISANDPTRWAMFICLRGEYYGTPYSLLDGEIKGMKIQIEDKQFHSS